MEQPTIIELDIKKIMKVNMLLTIILIPLFILIYILLYKGFSLSFHFWSLLWNVLLFFIGYLLLIVLHEAFHLIGFMLFGKAKYHDLNYGLNLELGIAYATTAQPLKNRAMKKALLLPFWMTGVLPILIGFYINSIMLIILGAILIAGAVGDFYMYKELRKFSNEALIEDDPELPKLYVYEEKEC